MPSVLNSHLPGIPRKQAVAAGGVHEFRGEHAGQQGARDSGHAVAGEHVERVVELRAGPNLDSRIADAGREHTDREPGQRGYVSSGRRDADETDDETGCRADRRDLAGAYQVEPRPSDEGRGRCGIRVHERERREPVRRECRAGIEAEPAKPEQAGAEQYQRDVVRRNGNTAVIAPWPEEPCGDERGHTGADMDDGAAREVQRTTLQQPPIGAPHPVRQRVVDQRRPEDQEHDVTSEAHPLHDRA